MHRTKHSMLDEDADIKPEAGVEWVEEVSLLRLVLMEDGLAIGVTGNKNAQTAKRFTSRLVNLYRSGRRFVIRILDRWDI